MSSIPTIDGNTALDTELKALIASGYAETSGIDPDMARLHKPFRSEELAATLLALDNRARPPIERVATSVEPAA